MKYLAAFLLLVPVIAASAISDYTEGQINWEHACFRLGNGTSSATIQVIDPDMNKFSGSTDTISIFVHSDSSPEGIALTLYETEEDSGIFERTFGLSNQRTAPNILYTQEGDTITAEYIDTATPSQKQSGTKIVETAFIGCSSPPLERVPASDARITNATGSTINHPMAGKQVQIQSDIANGQSREQKFAWITQITDEQDKIVSVGWITGALNADSAFSPSISWIPQKEGRYTATVFVWESLDNPTALSPPISIDFEVSKNQDAKKTTITHSLPLPPVTITIAEPVTLGLHQSAMIIGKDIQVTFSKINEDSRCPSGVTCVWKGTVSVQLDIKTKDGSKYLALSLQNNTARINDTYSVKLVDVIPYPSKVPIPEQEYTIVLQIAQAESWRSLTDHTIKVFDGKTFFASESLARKTGANETVTFMGIQFTHPSFPKIANPAGFISTTVTFSDGTKETIGTNDPARTFPVFTIHSPQAGLVMNKDGTLSLLVGVNQSEISPLQQLKAGIPVEKIQCKENNVVLLKPNREFGGCFSPDNAMELYSRGWPSPNDSVGVFLDEPTIPQVKILKGSVNPEQMENYSPKNILVVIGTNNTMTWINEDDAPSSVTSDNDLFDSGPIMPNSTWSHTFEKTGFYSYHSVPHPWMRAYVVVLPQNPESLQQQEKQDIARNIIEKQIGDTISSVYVDENGTFVVGVYGPTLQRNFHPETFYEKKLQGIVPFDVPMRIEFGQTPLHGIAEIASYKGKDCNQPGFSGLSCFADSFSSCTNARIEETYHTQEGDLITLLAMIKNNDVVCTIDFFEDTTKDRFGSQKITKYSCSKMELDYRHLNISSCTNDYDDGTYGFSIQNPS